MLPSTSNPMARSSAREVRITKWHASPAPCSLLARLPQQPATQAASQRGILGRASVDSSQVINPTSWPYPAVGGVTITLALLQTQGVVGPLSRLVKPAVGSLMGAAAAVLLMGAQPAFAEMEVSVAAVWALHAHLAVFPRASILACMSTPFPHAISPPPPTPSRPPFPPPPHTHANPSDTHMQTPYPHLPHPLGRCPTADGLPI